ncbi:RNA polymerase sigma-70 factor [Sphingobacterium siyangense]|jgi:RNA polymerase sigma-70 factor (ECF subfamily)|uniref:RNA polymerase sigma-70 factor n=1 Tax=Sphingobacterium siyangense TaxID=459529 RepID=UPI0028AD33E7|nr:RNA polymerase sigma-70 factor [Sphingobacterium siyangense]
MGPEEKLFRTHYKSLCHFAWKFVGESAIAEDLVQEAFITFFREQQRMDESETFVRNYLYTAVRFSCLKHLRHEKVKEKYWSRVKFIEEDAHSVELSMIHTEVINEVYRIIAEMPVACQKIFKMGYLEGLSNLEITEKLQISVNTVKTQKQRGMKILLDKLHPEFLPFIIFLLK